MPSERLTEADLAQIQRNSGTWLNTKLLIAEVTACWADIHRLRAALNVTLPFAYERMETHCPAALQECKAALDET